MPNDDRNLLDVLKFELEFLEQGGYGRLPRESWRTGFVFEDSPTCMNFNSKDHKPCSECLLMQFVPQEARKEQTPCIHIPLSPNGATLEALYRTGTQQEIEETLGAWLRTTIHGLEAEKMKQVTRLAPPERPLALDARIVLHSLAVTPDQLPKPAIRPYPLKYVAAWTMKDGNEVTIRPIRPEDEPLMVKFHGTLSDRTVYLRYFYSLSLSRRVEHERLLRICFTDYDREMALIVERTVTDTGERKILAVGRLNKLHTSNQAEVAVLVSDQYQKLGLGYELLRRVIEIAKDEKLSQVSAEMLPDNVAMQVITKRLGFKVRTSEDQTSVRALLDL